MHQKVAHFVAFYIIQMKISLTKSSLYAMILMSLIPCWAAKNIIDALAARYTHGWQQTREERKKRMIELGLIKDEWGLAE